MVGFLQFENPFSKASATLVAPKYTHRENSTEEGEHIPAPPLCKVLAFWDRLIKDKVTV